MEKRVHVKLIRFAPSELQIVTARARAVGRPLACYIREASLGVPSRARRTNASDELIRLLARLASHLAQLSREAAEQQLGGAPEFETALKEVMEAIRRLD
jgi:hypothetical protein